MNRKRSIKLLWVVGMACVFFSAFCLNTFGQSNQGWSKDKGAKLKQYLQQLNGENRFNGTVLLAEDGDVVFHESLGYSDIGKKKKLDRKASFRLASVSKQFTCMGIMLLKKAGKLDYDDEVRKHIADFPYDQITIRQLMHHTSGLPDYMMLMVMQWDTGKKPEEKKIAFNKDMIDQLVAHKPKLRFEPGEKFEYSNTGYVVLGYLIEVISGKTTGQYLTDSIFKPLNMEHSHVFSPDASFAPEHRVFGFSFAESKTGFIENDHHFLNGMVGDGGIYATAADMLKWDQALYTEKLVSQAMIEEAFTSGILNDGKKTGYGFGWSIDNIPDAGLQVSHGGGWVGFRTYIVRNVSNKRTIIILTNHSSRHLDKVLKKIEELDSAP